MALDPIWQQQLTLVSYGNEYLKHQLSFQTWLNHPIFEQSQLQFRDLLSQQLLAPHFQVWLEHLKKQGCTQLSLHRSDVLVEQKNPNANVELVPYAHFIVSHHKQAKTAWIFGKELPLWYQGDEDYRAPLGQQNPLRFETLWRFDLPTKLHKRVDSDLAIPNWQDIHHYMQQELFVHPLAQQLPLSHLEHHFTGLNSQATHKQSLLLAQYDVPYAHYSLQRMAHLSSYIQQQIQHPQDAQGHSLSAEQLLNLRHFSQKIDDLYAKLIVKIANHYTSATLGLAELAPLDPVPHPEDRSLANKRTASNPTDTTTKKPLGVIKLILITVVICFLAYYFGL